MGSGDVTQTRDLLRNEFDRLIAPPGQSGGGSGEMQGEGVRVSAAPGRRVDPGMSVLQDSVLGMPADGMNKTICSVMVMYSDRDILK